MTDQSGEVSCGSTTDPSSSARVGDHANNSSSSPSGGLKCCTICRTTKTPLWRGGPSGPKSLCNACGIRYRKDRRESMGLSNGAEKKINKENKNSNNRVKIKNKDNKSGGGGGGGGGGKMDVLRFDAEVLLKERSNLWLKRRRRRRLAEEEEAAVLLMALSSGFL